MAQQDIPLDKLPSVLRSGKINPEQAKRAFFKNARMILIAETKKCFDEGRGPDGEVILECVDRGRQHHCEIRAS